MIKFNLIGTLNDEISAKLDSVKADAFVHQQGFEESLSKRDLKAALSQYAETLIYRAQTIACLDILEIMFGASDGSRSEIKENYRVMERNLVLLEALRRELNPPVRV